MWSPGTFATVRRSPSSSRRRLTSSGVVYSVSSATTIRVGQEGAGGAVSRARRTSFGRGLRVAEPQAAVRAGLRVPRPPPRGARAVRGARLHFEADELVGVREGAVGPLALCELARRPPARRRGRGRGGRRVRRTPACGGKLEDEPAAEAGADPGRRANRLGELDDVRAVRRNAPGRIPARPAVPSRSGATTRNPRGTSRSSARRR